MQRNQRKENYWYILKFQEVKARRHQDPCGGINVVWAPCHPRRLLFSSSCLSGCPSWPLTHPASLASVSSSVLPPVCHLPSSLSLSVSWYLPQSPEAVCKGVVGCTDQLLGSSLPNLRPGRDGHGTGVQNTCELNWQGYTCATRCKLGQGFEKVQST